MEEVTRDISRTPPLLILTGPTASGKTGVGIRVAQSLDAEIISADSRQVYRRLDIGTAKPSPEQRRAVPHHFIDIRDPHDAYSAGEFFTEATAMMGAMHAQGRRVIVVGGSGLHVRALAHGIAALPQADAETRRRLEAVRATSGTAPLLEELRAHDPAYAEVVDPDNAPRVIRALEVCLITGMPYSRLRRERMPVLPYRACMAGLRWDRAALYARIDARVDAMLADGLVDEVRALLASGINGTAQAFRTVGYAEVLRFLAGDVDHVTMVVQIKQHTRNYAKRQETWFRKEPALRWYDVAGEEDLEHAADRIAEDFAEGRIPEAVNGYGEPGNTNA